MPKRPNTVVRLKSGATSYDVAIRAGVSQSAVSRCFKEGASVAPATRARILQAAKELRYAPNAIASGLITRRSHLVAVLISHTTNLHSPEVLGEITRRLALRGFRVLLFALQSEEDTPAALAQVRRYRVDGVIAVARLDAASIRDFAVNQVPLVMYNRDSESGPASSVCCDSVGGSQTLIDRLAAAGHRRFGVISGPASSFVSQQRVHGAVSRLEALGLAYDVAPGAFDYASGEVGLRRLMLQTDNALDALVCANDAMAMGAMDCARHTMRLSVPGDMSVVGFDGTATAAWASYDLTTIRQPVLRMTEAAVEMIVQRMEQPDLSPEQRTFTGQFVEGSSARLANAVAPETPALAPGIAAAD